MNNTYYGVYCKDILGIKTNVRQFCWVYGTAPLISDEEEYQNCIVKMNVNITSEKKLEKAKRCDRSFQSYVWDSENKKLHYRQTILGVPIGYNIHLDGTTIYANIGENYYKFIKRRVMNLHGIYYLLADIANIVLLNSGYLTLYASAVVDESSECGTVLFAPPNTGKTVTAIMLCKYFGYSLVGEDVVITDGNRIYGCPWTHSYRKKGNHIDSAGYFSREKSREELNYCDACNVSDLVILSLGNYAINTDKIELFREIKILNGYLFCHYHSPIVKILSYFDQAYDISYGERAGKILHDMVEQCCCRSIQTNDAMDFYKLIGTKTPNAKK